MRRRQFISALASAVAAWPSPARAQPGERLRRIGVLLPLAETDRIQKARVGTLRESLERLGWADGRNVRIDYRYAAGGQDKFAPLAREVVALQPDVIFVNSSGFVAAVHRETRTIPIVFTNVSDPVGAGFVANLSRPGGNLTGMLLFEAGIAGKWLSMLKEFAPGLKRTALMGNPKTTLYDYFLRNTEAAASALAIKVVPARVESIADIERALDTVAGEPDGGLVVAPDSTMLRYRNVIVALAARHRLPAVYPERFYVDDGGLMSYGVADLHEPFRQAASYVDRILRGQKPADLPVQAPTKYSTVLNLKTAKALGLTVPPGLLVAADEVIE